MSKLKTLDKWKFPNASYGRWNNDWGESVPEPDCKAQPDCPDIRVQSSCEPSDESNNT